MKDLHLILIIGSFVWVVGVVAGMWIRNKTKTIKIKHSKGDPFKAADPKYIVMPEIKREIRFNLIFDENSPVDASEEMLCDITVNIEQLIKGNYRLPEKFLKERDVFKIEEAEEIKVKGNEVLSFNEEDYS